MTSIHDVAALAKVSIKTVSRVVNKAPNVSDALRDRVQAAIAQLGYRPNQSAWRLAGGRSFMIAFLYNNPAPGYVSRIQMGAAWRCPKRPQEFKFNGRVVPVVASPYFQDRM